MIVPAFLLTAAQRLAGPLVVVGVLGAAWGIGYWHGSTSEASQHAEQMVTAIKKAEDERTALLRRLMSSEYDLAQANAALAKKARVITKEIVREVEKPVYRDCRIPDDGVRLLQRARGQPEAAPSAGRPGAVRGDPAAAR